MRERLVQKIYTLGHPALTRSFMALQHELGLPVLIPKLDSTVLRARDDLLAGIQDRNGEHIILVAREIQHALASPALRTL